MTSAATHCVYRVEDENGDGPYRGPSSYHLPLLDLHIDDMHKPGPTCDGLDRHPEHWASQRFGFKSLAQLKAWFATEAERRELADAGFHVALYEVPAASHKAGYRQVIFDATAARRINTLPIPDTGPVQLDLPLAA